MLKKVLSLVLALMMTFSMAMPALALELETVETEVPTGETVEPEAVEPAAVTDGETVEPQASTDAVKVEHNGETTYYADLQAAFDGFAPSNNTYGGIYVVTLLGDTTGVSKNLQYPTEVLNVTLDLNGHTITGPSGSSTTVVNINFGSKNSTDCVFTIKDSSGNNSGKITGGKNGVIFSGKNSTLNFEGGTITGNHGGTKGGGINVGATAYLNMTGGVITGNSVTGTSSANTGLGGGVLANYASITGGVITGNTANGGTGKQTGRGGGVCTEITRTKGYSTLTIADGVVYGNTAENAGDDVMAQGNGMSGTKYTLSIGTAGWYIDGWNGKKATAGNGETDRYSAENPVAYTDGGFTNTYNKSIGLKYVASAAEEVGPEAPHGGTDKNVADGIYKMECYVWASHDGNGVSVIEHYPGTNYATNGEVTKNAEGKWTCDVTVRLKAVFEENYLQGIFKGHTAVTELPETEVFTAVWDEEQELWVWTETPVYELACVAVPPEAPEQKNTVENLVAVICDSDHDRHETVYGKWYPNHCSTTSEIVWNQDFDAWTVDVRIGSLYIMYVDQLEDANNGTIHELPEDITTVYATLKWDEDSSLWVPTEDIELHVTCKTVPDAPLYNQLDSYQVKVKGDIDGDGVYGETKATNDGVGEVYTTSIPEDGYTLSEVYGSREEGFFVDVTVTLADGDIYQNNWIEKCNPGYYYNYDWEKTPATVTFTLVYNGDLNGTLYGNRHAVNTNYDWILPTTGKTYGVIAEAYLDQVEVNVVVKGVVNGDKENAETIFTGMAPKGANTVEWLNANVEIPAKDGYTADAWYNWDWYGHKVGEDATINGWTNVYVTYTANEYTLTLDPNGGKVDPETITVTYNEAIGELPEATRSGYIFDGWVDAEGNEVTAETVYTVAGDSTVTAQWIRHPGSSSQNVTNELFTIQCTVNHDHSWLCNWFGSHVKLVSGSVTWNEELGRWEAQAKIGSSMFSQINATQPRKNYFGNTKHYYDEYNFVIDLYYDPDFTGLNSQKKEVTGMWLPAQEYVFYVYCYTEPSMPDVSKVTDRALWVRDTDYDYRNAKYSTKYTVKQLIDGTYTLGEMYTVDGKFYVDLTITDISAYVNALSTKNGKNYVLPEWQNHKGADDFKFTLVYTPKTNPIDYAQDGSGWKVDASSYANTKDKNNGKSLWLTEQFTVTYTDGADGAYFAEEVYTVYAQSENGGTKDDWADFSDTATPAFAGEAVRTGYTFAGWTPEVAETVTESVVYTAIWNANEYVVTFNTNGGEAKDPITVVYGEKYGTALNKVPSVTGLSARKTDWYLVDENGNVTDTNIRNSSVVSVARDHELFLMRDVLAPTLKITLEVPGAISNDYKYYVPGNSTRILTVTVNNRNDEILDYTYQWYKDGVAIEGATEAVLTLPGNVSDSGTYEVVVTATLKDGTGIVVNVASASGEKSIKVQIMRVANTLRLNENYGEAPATSDSYFGGAVATIRSEASREGYTFIGWNTAADGSGTMYQSGDEVEFPGDNGNGGVVLELYAQWKANEYTVTLNPGDGEVDPSTITVTYDSAIGELPVPVLYGYDFTGWYDANGNLVTAETVYTVAGDSELTAGWTPHIFTVTFEAKGVAGYPSEKGVAYGSTVGELPVPYIPGTVFLGWYVDGVRVDENYVVTGDVTLTARFMVASAEDGEGHDWTEWKTEGNIKWRECKECGLVEKIYINTGKTDGESNPNTGAAVPSESAVSAFAAIAVLGTAAYVLGKRK